MTGKSRIPCASPARPERQTSETGLDEHVSSLSGAASTSEAGDNPGAAEASSAPQQEDARKQQLNADATEPDAAAQEAKAAKAALRRQLKAARASLDGPGKQARDARIGAQILAWWRRTRPPLLAVYWPLSGEPDLADTYAQLVREGAGLALPVVVRRHAALAFAAWTPGEAMHHDAVGVAVPATLRMVERPPALLVPCLGFDEQGYRLGYGGGFYDRTLAGGIRPATLGIAYACQATTFTIDSHDLPLDLIVTETTNVE